MNSSFEQQQEAQFLRMTQTPIPKLITTLAVPTIISMMVTSVYNMADTYFVSQLGTSASGAVGIIFPLMAMIQAIGFTLGMGSGTFISRLLGQKERDRACQVAAGGFFAALAAGALLAVVGLVFTEPLVRLLGATDTILPYARDYARYILIGAPYMAASFVLNNQLRGQGRAALSMVGIAIGGVLNIVLDPLFIFTFELGISGAALATILSQLISFLILLFFSMGQFGTIPVRLRSLSLNPKIYSEIVRMGFPSFCRQGLASIATVALNTAAGVYGDGAIAAMSIVTRVMMFMTSALLGFGQGFQPVCGFNYGAKRCDRVLEGFWFCVRVAVVGLALLCACMAFFAPQMMALFRRDDLEVIAIGTLAMRLQCLTLPLVGVSICCNMLTQSLAFSLPATLMALGRQGLFFLPAILRLPRVFELLGVQLAQPTADVCTFLLAALLTRNVLRHLTELNEQQREERGRQP